MHGNENEARRNTVVVKNTISGRNMAQVVASEDTFGHVGLTLGVISPYGTHRRDPLLAYIVSTGCARA